MPNCEFVTSISILACNIAKNKTPEELSIISAFFVQLRRYFSYTCNNKVTPVHYITRGSIKYLNIFLN